MEYLIGLDLGTGSVKTVLFDQNGKEIAQMAQEYPVYQPNNGWSEQDPENPVSRETPSRESGCPAR